ncbi:hypothetical protein ACLB6G_20305 [Zhengella sp. ZM62]|uniref:hypothetical protein n=1 Tax=Zhengella sedimenti TaxID=3390035 RepID=UPI003975D427
MARLLSWQARVAQMALANGPASAGSGSNTLANGSEQTFAGFNTALAFEMTLPPSQGQRSRSEYGWLLALFNGANATRYEYLDGQRMTAAEANVPATSAWSGGGAWAGGAWAVGYGTVALSANLAKGATTVTLENSLWGHRLNYGDAIGFGPSYWGCHFVTGVYGSGEYRVWPPIRAALTAGTHRANLQPRLALRAVPGSVSYGQFNPAYADGRSARLTEVFHEYVETYFQDK